MKRFLLMSMMILLIIIEAGWAKGPASSEDVKEPVKTSGNNILPTHKHTTNCDKTTAEPVQIICILDRSGSMRSLAGDTIGGYNSFIDKQKQESGEATVTTVLFDDKYEKIVDNVDLKQVLELTSSEYYARGTTALLDAVGRTIMETAGNMEKEGICPAKRHVLIIIMTDGLENASKEYDKTDVKAMIEATTNDYKWNYIFMGANIDSVAEANSIGIRASNAANYAHNQEGVRKSFGQMDTAAREVRETGEVKEDWNK